MCLSSNQFPSASSLRLQADNNRLRNTKIYKQSVLCSRTLLLLWSREQTSAANDPADFLSGNDNKEEQDRRDADVERTRRTLTLLRAALHAGSLSHGHILRSPLSSPLAFWICLVNMLARILLPQSQIGREVLRSHGLRELSSRQCIVLAGGNQGRRSISRSCGRS